MIRFRPLLLFPNRARSAFRCAALLAQRLGRCAALLVLVAAAGCVSSKPAATYAPARSASEAAVAGEIRAEVQAWKGTPHRWGGTSRQGVDCSGLTQALYGDLFGLTLPRTTHAQAREGQRVQPDALQAGDLVFFKTSAKDRHVGVYLEEGAFAHASSSAGVTVSHLGEPYWRQRYWQARRLLGPLEGDAASAPAMTRAEEPPPAAPRPAGSGRSGW